jgi:hypothetical protein
VLLLLWQVGRATALAALGALAAADAGSGAVLDRIHAASLPGRLLQELADAPPSAVLQRVRHLGFRLWVWVQRAHRCGGCVTARVFGSASEPCNVHFHRRGTHSRNDISKLQAPRGCVRGCGGGSICGRGLTACSR